ncbi:MAG: hypothetical protein WBL23_03460, partial [Salinisphaera sp.]|uniref:hypothetical protein n=1 Tax=Salinisphaera sp. TaxID=1914330 RepID=UPI003C7BC1F6
IVGRRLGLALAELRRTASVDRDAVAMIDAAIDRALLLWRGPYVVALLVTAVYGMTLASLFIGTGAAAGTWQHISGAGGSVPSLAGMWQLLVSAPLLRLLTLGWLWRWLIWAWLLWRIARASTRVSPMHPDKAGGLGFLGAAQTGFATVVLAFSVQVGSLVADAVVFRGTRLANYQGQAVLFVILSLLFVFAPLLVFTAKLARAKWEAEAPLSGWANRAERLLEKELREDDTASPLSESAISTLCDYGTLFAQARQMRIIPVSNRDLAFVVSAALLPAMPLMFVAMPAKEILQKMLNVLI